MNALSAFRSGRISSRTIRRAFFRLASILVWMSFLCASDSGAASLKLEELKLPPLRIESRPARAHTQGLEIVDGQFYVSARRDDAQPKRALLLRTTASRTDWDVWDITPSVDSRNGDGPALDHPGGMQSDGKRLWIPVAESRRRGRSVIRVFSVAGLQPGKPAAPGFEFMVNDHIGAVAVSPDHQEILGASWDTENIYVWDFAGRAKRQWTATELNARHLGIAAGSDGRSGVAVQDWKIQGNRLYASGLFKSIGSPPPPPSSRVLVLQLYSESAVESSLFVLPRHQGAELAQEAMAIAHGHIYFLPEDLGASNRLFRLPLAEVLEAGQPPPKP